MKRKFLKPAIAVALVASMAVGGSLAYITAQTDPITNEFKMASTNKENDSVLDIDIKENFTVTDSEGTRDLYDDETKETITAEVLPGDRITKSPIISLESLDGDLLKQGAYIFAEVTDADGLMGEDGKLGFTVNEAVWKPVDGYAGIYYYYQEDGITTAEDLPPVFLKTDIIVNDDFHSSEIQSIVVTGYAIQAQGYDEAVMSEVVAWKAVKGIV